MQTLTHYVHLFDLFSLFYVYNLFNLFTLIYLYVGFVSNWFDVIYNQIICSIFIHLIYFIICILSIPLKEQTCLAKKGLGSKSRLNTRIFCRLVSDLFAENIGDMFADILLSVLILAIIKKKSYIWYGGWPSNPSLHHSRGAGPGLK